MVMDGVLFLAARTARSQAYAQAMQRAALAPAHTLLLAAPPGGTPTGEPASADLGKLPCPDLSEALEVTAARGGWDHETLHSADVNDGELRATLQRLCPRLVIYCGYGGQIVGDALLDLRVPFLHLHSGWLPDFRGSTTLYYALLAGQQPAVSAILLDQRIDEGHILMRRRYPRPAADVDLDLLYDNAIRADLLVRVLRRYQRRRALWRGRAQSPGTGRSYYVIHPVLKHIARLSLHEDVAD